MGLLEQIVLRFKADTSDLKQELKSVQGAEREAVQESIKLAEARNKSLDSHVDKLKTIEVGMQVVQRAIGFMGAAWEEYEKKALAAGGADAEKAKSFRAALDKMGEAVSHFMAAVGKLVVSLEPLLDVVAAIIDKVADAVDWLGSGATGDEWKQKVQRANGTGVELYGAEHGQKMYGAAFAGRDLTESINIAAAGIVEAGRIAAMGGVEKAKAIKPKQRGKGTPAEEVIPIEYYGEDYAGRGGGAFATGFGGAAESFGPSAGLLGSMGDNQAMFDSLATLSEELKHMGSESALEIMFGPIEDFNAYGTAFDALTGSVVAGFEAWMTGADSFAGAMKKALAASATAAASEMLMQALKHSAFAVGALAFGDFKGAATHALAAAKFAAGAMAIGSIAKVANAGLAQSAGQTPSAPNVGRATAGEEQSGGRNVTVVLGDSMADDSPRWRSRHTARAIRRANRELDQGGGGVIYQ